MLTKEELRIWKRDPVTIKVMEKLQDRANDFVRNAADGTALNQDEKKVGGTPWTVGVIYGAQLILTIEGEEENESVGNKSS